VPIALQKPFAFGCHTNPAHSTGEHPRGVILLKNWWQFYLQRLVAEAYTFSSQDMLAMDNSAEVQGSTGIVALGRPATIQPGLARIYNRYRTSLLNVKYYGYKLIWSQRVNLWAELVIAISACSGVSGWAIWGQEAGHQVWSIIAGTAAVLAAIKPIVPLTKNISRYSKLYGSYNSNYLALKDLVERISVEEGLSKDIQDEFERISKQHREIAMDDDPKPSKRLLTKFMREVETQIPPEQLWCPR
jgi:hypothetical protein